MSPEDPLAPSAETTLDDRFRPLVGALERSFDMPADDAVAVVEIVAETFGPDPEVRDEELDSETRSIFYMLEDQDLLTFRRSTFEDEDGRTLRAYHWHVKEATLRELAGDAADDREDATAGVYDEIPRDVWSKRAA